MHESVALVLTLPDGEHVLQRRDEDAPSARGMLAFFGGGVEEFDLCRHHAAAREQDEEINKEFDLEYVGYFLYLSHRTENKPILCINVYKGEVDEVPAVNEGTAEVVDLSELSGRVDIATSSEAILARMKGNTWH